MARVKQDLRESLEAAGMLGEIGEDRIFMTLPTAVGEFKAGDGSRRPAEPETPDG
jgi:SulP family sulfate permease